MHTHEHTHIYIHIHTHIVLHLYLIPGCSDNSMHANMHTNEQHICTDATDTVNEPWGYQPTADIWANGTVKFTDQQGRIYQTHGAYRHNKMATTSNMSLGKPFKPFKNQTAGMGDRFFIFRMIGECEKPNAYPLSPIFTRHGWYTLWSWLTLLWKNTLFIIGKSTINGNFQ